MEPQLSLHQTPDLSIIIPTLNESRAIGATLDSLAELRGTIEFLVVDGGSDDDTVTQAERRGVRVITASRGRGSQMHAGAKEARADALWFLHADTHAPRDSVERILECLRDPRIAGGNFMLLFDGGSRAARFLTWFYVHIRKIGLCYGDSGFFVRRSAYEAAGGFRPYPIFEDLDLVCRLRRVGKFVRLPARIVTSSRRFERRSFTLVFLRWCLLQVLYWLGVSPVILGRLYQPVR